MYLCKHANGNSFNKSWINKQGKKTNIALHCGRIVMMSLKAASYFVQSTISFMNYIYRLLTSKVIPFKIDCNVDRMYDQ